jgi:hypothetical protein
MKENSGTSPESKVGIKTVLAFKADNVLEAVAGIAAFLNVLEIDEWIVLHGVKCNDIRLREWRILRWQDLGEIRGVGVFTIAGGNQIRTSERQALLIALPRKAMLDQLISNGLSADVVGRWDGLDPVDV